MLNWQDALKSAKNTIGNSSWGLPIKTAGTIFNQMIKPQKRETLNYTPMSTSALQSMITPKTNTQDVKSSTLSQPKYNPTANVINQNALNNISEQKEPDWNSVIQGLQGLSTGLQNLQTPQVSTPTELTEPAKPVESEADKWFKMYKESLGMTPEEEALQNQLSNLTTGADLGVAGLEGQGRGIPLGLVRGQQEKLLKQAAIQTQPLQKQLELLQAKRQAQMEGAKAGMEYYKPIATDYKSVSAGETLIDPKTGKVIYQGQPKEQSMSERYGTGVIGEYNFYADQEKQMGREPLSFDEYQVRDANRKLKASTVGSDNESYSLAQTVLNNPSLFNQLTATEKGKVAPALAAMGFTAFGKPLSDTAIKEITEKQVALENIESLSESISDNKQYIGPISGFQALNPWSPAKKVQADINRVRQIVGKALEGGVLRKEDEEKYKKILPTVNDTMETVLYKMKQLKAQITWDIENYQNQQMLGGRAVTTSNNNSDPLGLR